MNKKIVSKSAKYVMLVAMAGSAATGLVLPTVSQAAEVSPEVTQLLSDQVRLSSGVAYVDASGTHELEIPANAQVKLNATKKSIVLSFNGKKHTLNNVREVTFKGITVTHLVPFYADGVSKVTLDSVNFQKGVDFSGMKDVQSLIVKDSTFGATDYSLAIHSAPKLTNLVMDNSSFTADVRIYSNHALATATVSNSVLKDDVKQYSNKKGYFTEFVSNRFERSRVQKVLASGGMNANDIFYINRNNDPIAPSRFDASQPGVVIYKMADRVAQRFEVPAGTTITTVNDVGNKITIKLSNGQSIVLNDAKELTFRNVNIATHVAFTQKGLLLEKLSFVNSKTRLIDVAYSNTMKSFEIHRSEVSQSSGYVSVYNNKALENFIMQESSVKGSSGYISVYNIPTLKTFVMNNDYTYGYLSAYNLGSSVLQISNSHFDDYISTSQVIEGEGGRQIIGDAPVLKETGKTLQAGSPFILSEFVSATDTEDGILTNIDIVAGYVNPYSPGQYPITVSVTDSDDNTVEMDVIIVVE